MAVNTEKAKVEVDVDGKQAETKLKSLNAEAEELRDTIISMKKSELVDPKKLADAEKALKKVNKEIRNIKKDAFDTEKVLKDINGASMNDLLKAQKKIRREFRNAKKNSDEYNASVGKLKQLKGAIDSHRRELGTIRSSWSRIKETALGFLGGNLLYDGLRKVQQVLSESVEDYNAYEEKLDNLQSLTGLAGEELEYLKETSFETSTSINEDGVRITKSADDIIDAYTKMGSKRPELLKNKEALAAVTEDAIILAEAAKIELEPAVEGLAITMNQFNSEASESRKIINILGAGSKAGAADIPYLSKAMEKAGTTANLMNLSIEETAAAIETVAPFYGEASAAGNSLDKVLLKLKEKNIGYKDGVFDMNLAIDEMRQRMNDGESAADLFGVEHAKMGELLVQNQTQFNEFTKAVTGSNTAVEQAIINTDNNTSKLAQSKNEMHNASIELGEQMAPAFLAVTNGITLMFKGLVILIKFLVDHRKELIIAGSAVAAYTAYIKASVIADNLKKISLNGVTGGLKKMYKTLIANPYAAVTAAVVAGVVALIAYKDEIFGINKEAKRFEDANEKINDSYLEQSASLKLLQRQLEQGNLTTEQREEIINKLNSQYGDLLENQIEQTATEEELAVAMNQVNDALLQRIRMEVYQETLKEILKEEQKLNEELENSIEKQKEYNKQSGTKNILGRAFVALSGNINDATKGWTGIIEDQTQALKENQSEQQKYLDLINGIQEQNLTTGGAVSDAEEEEKQKIITQKQKDAAEKRAKDVEAANEKLREIIRKSYIDQQTDQRAKLEAQRLEEIRFVNISIANEELKIEAIKAINAEYAAKANQLDIKAAEDKAKEDEKLLKMQEDFEKEKLELKKKYNILSLDELQALEIEQLTLFNQEKLLTEEEFQIAKQEIIDRYEIIRQEKDAEIAKAEIEKQKEKLANIQAAAQLASDFISALKERELTNVVDVDEEKIKQEKNYYTQLDETDSEYAARKEQIEKEITDNQKKVEEERKNIAKKYALLELAASAATIIGKTAEGIIKAVAASPLTGGLPWSAAIGVTGAAQLALAVAQTNKVKQFAKGYKMPVIGADDSKLYNAAISSGSTGLYSSPTYTPGFGLYGERGPEIVIDAPTTKNLQVNYPEVMTAIAHARVPQFATGTPAIEAPTTQLQENQNKLSDSIDRLDNKLNQPIRAYIVYSDIADSSDEVNAIIEDVSSQ